MVVRVFRIFYEEKRTFELGSIHVVAQNKDAAVAMSDLDTEKFDIIAVRDDTFNYFKVPQSNDFSYDDFVLEFWSCFKRFDFGDIEADFYSRAIADYILKGGVYVDNA